MCLPPIYPLVAGWRREILVPGTPTKHHLLTISSYEAEEISVLGESAGDAAGGPAIVGLAFTTGGRSVFSSEPVMRRDAGSGFFLDFMYKPSELEIILSFAFWMALVRESLKSYRWENWPLGAVKPLDKLSPGTSEQLRTPLSLRPRGPDSPR